MKVATGVVAAGVVVAVTLIRARTKAETEPQQAVAAATPAAEFAARETA